MNERHFDFSTSEMMPVFTSYDKLSSLLWNIPQYKMCGLTLWQVVSICKTWQLALAVATSDKCKMAVHNFGRRYPVEISAPRRKCTALHYNRCVCDLEQQLLSNSLLMKWLDSQTWICQIHPQELVKETKTEAEEKKVNTPVTLYSIRAVNKCICTIYTSYFYLAKVTKADNLCRITIHK